MSKFMSRVKNASATSRKPVQVESAMPSAQARIGVDEPRTCQQVRGLPTLSFQVLGGLLAGQSADSLAASVGIEPLRLQRVLDDLCRHFEVRSPRQIVDLFTATTD